MALSPRLPNSDYIPATKATARQMGFDGRTVRAPVCKSGPTAETEIARRMQALRG